MPELSTGRTEPGSGAPRMMRQISSTHTSAACQSVGDCSSVQPSLGPDPNPSQIPAINFMNSDTQRHDWHASGDLAGVGKLYGGRQKTGASVNLIAGGIRRGI